MKQPLLNKSEQRYLIIRITDKRDERLQGVRDLAEKMHPHANGDMKHHISREMKAGRTAPIPTKQFAVTLARVSCHDSKGPDSIAHLFTNAKRLIKGYKALDANYYEFKQSEKLRIGETAQKLIDKIMLKRERNLIHEVEAYCK